MANFTALKTAINNAIKTNGNEEITGAILQAILDAMVETLGDSAINDLENAITTEVTNRENAVGGVADDLAAEVLARANKDNQLDGRINQEEYNRQNADAALSQTMSQGFQTLGSQMTALNAAISALNAAYQNGYLYGGIATPSSSPSNNKCFYIALQGGTYTNFGGVGVVEGINIIKNDRGWKVEHIYDQTTLLNEFYLLRQQVIRALASYEPIVVYGDVTNAPDEEDLTSNAQHLLKFKDRDYSPLNFSGLGMKILRKNILPLNDSVAFNGFLEGVTAEETLAGSPELIFWDRINSRFVGIKDGIYYAAWTDDDNYVPVSTSLVYMYNGTPYQWTGSDFTVDETEVPNLVNCLTQDMINEANTIYIIRYDYTLKEDITIPEGCVLQFDGGSISDDGTHTLTGNNTRMIYDSPIFNNINIQGIWLVPIIHGYIFKNIEGVNVARNLAALCNTNIENTIIIDKTTTCTFDLASNPTGISISDNTTLVLNGKLQIHPNNLQSYSVITLNGKNIQLIGSGSVYGDKPQHTGSEGEWGDGIRIIGENILVDGISVYDCWGDCINLDGAKKIEIRNFLLNNGRRQGISITDADTVNIHGGTISNTGGTDPQYGIDLEPNTDCNVNNIIIDTVVFTSNTRGAIAMNGNHNDIHNVLINNCYCDLNGENTEEGKDKAVITTYKVFNLEIKNTTIKAPNTRIISIQNCEAILRNCELSTTVENNYPLFFLGNTKVRIDTCTISCVRYCFRTLSNITIINSNISVLSATTELFYPDTNTYPQNCYISNCNIKGAFNKLINCLNLILDNNSFDGHVALTSGNNVTIKNNTIKTLTVTGISKIDISKNKVSGFIQYTGGSSIEGVNISKNILLGEQTTLSSVLYLTSASKAIVKDNILNCTHNGSAIYVNADKSIIKDNVIKGEQLSYGIQTQDLVDCIVESNVIIGNPTHPIKNFGSPSNTYFGDPANMKRFGTFAEKPTPYIIGFQYFNRDTNKVITWNGTIWCNPDGTEALS